MMNKTLKIIITGTRGLLGSSLLRSRPKNVLILSDYFDITNRISVGETFYKTHPDVVIHTASMGDIDICEKNKKKARQVNVLGTINLLKETKKNKTKFVFISSAEVFSGKKKYYVEEDPLDPVNHYGRTKQHAEKLVLNAKLPFLIFRLAPMFGWHSKSARYNHVTWVIDRLLNKKKVVAVGNVTRNYIYVDDVAKLIWKAVITEKNGIFHVGGDDELSRFDISMLTAEVFGLDKKLIRRVKSDYFGKIAPRSGSLFMSHKKAQKILAFHPIKTKEALLKMKYEKRP